MDASSYSHHAMLTCTLPKTLALTSYTQHRSYYAWILTRMLHASSRLRSSLNSVLSLEAAAAAGNKSSLAWAPRLL